VQTFDPERPAAITASSEALDLLDHKALGLKL
jgi:hypothetical protein